MEHTFEADATLASDHAALFSGETPTTLLESLAARPVAPPVEERHTPPPPRAVDQRSTWNTAPLPPLPETTELETLTFALRRPERLEAVRRALPLHTPPEEEFDRLTRLAAQALRVPIVLLSLITEDRQIVKSSVGLPEPWATTRELPLTHSICQHVVATGAPLRIPDARHQPHARQHPALGELGLGAYASVPLLTADGLAIGAVCAMEPQARAWREEDIEVLRTVAATAMATVSARTAVAEAEALVEQARNERTTRATLLEATSEGLLALDREGRCTFANRAASQLLGYAPEELLGRQAHLMLHHTREDGTRCASCPIPQALKTGEGGLVERDVLWCKDGTPLPVSFAAYAVISGHVTTGVIVTFRDQREQRMREVRAHEAEQAGHTAFAHAAVGMAALSQTGEWLDVNERLAEWLGQPREALLGQQARTFLTPEAPATEEDAELRAAEPVVREERCRGADGRTRWLQTTLTPLLDAEGQPQRWLATYEDVTLRKRTEEERLRLLEFVRGLTSHLEEGVLALSREGRIVFANPAALRLLGWAEAALLGTLLHESVAAAAEDATTAPLLEVLRTGETYTAAEATLRRQDGQPLHVALTCSPLRLARNVAGLALVFREHSAAATTPEATGETASETTSEDAGEAVTGLAALRSLYESAPVMMGILRLEEDGDLTVLSCNSAAARIFGLEAAQVANRRVSTLLPMRVVRTWVQLHQSAASAGGPVTKEYSFPVGRELHYFSATLCPLPSAHFSFAVHDLTALKRSEEALRRLTNEQQAIFDAVPAGILYKDMKHRYVRVNAAAERLHGHPAAEMLGKTAQEIGSPYGDLYDAEDDLVLQSGEARPSVVLPASTRDGTVRMLQTERIPYRDAAGRVTGVIVFTQDVTERLRAEEALRNEQWHLRQIVTHAPVAMAMFDTELCYITHSTKWLTDYGLRGFSILGRHHFDVFRTVPERWREVYARALAGESFEDASDEVLRPDGTKLYLRWAIHPWYTPRDEIGGIVVASLPINELVEAREAALEALRLKTEFLANVSHEIRTPLSGVMGMSELLLHSALDADQREYAALVHRSAVTLLDVLNDVLDYSKIEAGKLHLEHIPFEARAVAQGVVDHLRPRAEEKHLTLRVQVDEALAHPLWGDPTHLRQVLMNLVGNAIKFTEQGEVELTASVAERTPTQTTLCFAVRDTGIGIPQAARERLFEPFTQADGSTVRKYGGTGLGLAISKRLVVMMGGEIGVQSEEGQGSMFYVTVPFQHGEPELEESAPPPEYAAPAAQAAPPVAEQERVDTGRLLLLVEDNAVNRRLATRQLEYLGHVVHTAASGYEAIAAMQRIPYALVLMDCQMPEMDGYEATRAIRAAEAKTGKHTPILALTAHAQPEDRERCLAAGMDDYLTKPVLLEPLRTAVQQWLRTQAEAEANAQAEAEARAADEPPPALPTLDLAVLETLRELQMEGEPDVLAELGESYLTEAPTLLAALRASLASGDAQTFYRAAHTLKSSSANLGALALSHLSGALELRSSAGIPADAQAAVAALEAEYARASAALEQAIHP